MASQFNWDKPTMTIGELNEILHQQYGPECPTRILVEEPGKAVSYKNAVVGCECLRCGNKFSMSPFALISKKYLTGYVCANCGKLSDDALKERQKENMRIKTIETLKEHGIDVVKEAIEAAEAEKSGKKAKQARPDVLDDEFSSTADEDDMDMNSIYDLDESPAKATESAKSAQEPVEEDTSDNDVNDYMVSDDDYNGTIEETAVKEEEPVEEEVIEDDDTGDDESSEELVTEEPDPEPVRDEYQEQVDEGESSSQEEIVPEAEEVEDDDISADDILGVEIPETETESEPTEADEDPDTDEAAVTEEAVDEEPVEIVQANEAGEESTISDEAMVWVGDKPYSPDELSREFGKAIARIKSKLHYCPFDMDSCEIVDGRIQIKCTICGKPSTYSSFEELSEVVELEEALSRYGKTIGKGKINNYEMLPALVTKCPVCMKSVLDKGYNEYHKEKVMHMADEAHFEIVDADKHLFIDDASESFAVKVGTVKRYMRWTEILNKMVDRNNGNSVIDARTLKMFEQPKPKQPERSTESTVIKETVEQVKPTATKPVNIVIKPKSTVTVTPPQETKVAAQAEQIVIKPKTRDDYEREAKAATSTAEKLAGGSKKSSVISFNNADSTTAKGSMFTSDRANDTLGDMESDRAKKEHDVEKHNVFSINQKFKVGKKDVARLNGKINPFEREISLRQEFEETVFAEFMAQLSERSGVDYKLVLNDSTYEIPVIDFESGIRIICSDLNESDLVNAHYDWINPRTPFSFFEQYAEDNGSGILKKKRKAYKWCVLFSDSVEYARDATFAALIKYTNPSILAYEGKKVILQDNLIFQYTKHNQYLRDFDKRNSTYPSRKPSTGSIGIIARWNSSVQATAKDVLKFKLQAESANSGNVANLDTLANNYNEYMVASIKYIEQFNKQTNRVIYTITEYVEVGSSIVGDGFTQCLRALLKEYYLKYPQLSGIDPFVLVEVDPSAFPSPSLNEYIEHGTLCRVDAVFKSMMTGQMITQDAVDRNYKYSYVRRPEYRRNTEIDNMRQDRRMFTTGSLIARMSEEIKQAGLSNTIRNPEVRKTFIENMGYIEASQPEIKLYFVNRSILSTLMVDGFTMSLQEHIDENAFNATKMVNNSNMGVSANNVMMNPNLMMKYNNIMQNGTAEAKELYARMMQEEYQQKMMDVMTHSQGQGQAQVNMNPMMNSMMMGMGGMPMGMMGNPMMGNGMMPPMGMMPGMGF